MNSLVSSDRFTDERDGHSYRTVIIGDQLWLAENLRYLPAVSPISERLLWPPWQHRQNRSQTAPYYYVHGYHGKQISAAQATANFRSYGALYNWPAALTACPPGWHLPTDAEWTHLVHTLMAEYNLLNDWVHTNCVGNALKSRRQIESPLGGANNTAEHPRWESSQTPPPERGTVAVGAQAHYGTDLVGFAALPGGRYAYSSFTELGFTGFWWSATAYGDTRAFYYFMRHEFGDVTRFNFDKSAGLSVRCIQNA